MCGREGVRVSVLYAMAGAVVLGIAKTEELARIDAHAMCQGKVSAGERSARFAL